MLELLDRGAGLDAELVDEQGPGLPIHAERLCLSTGAVQRQHQLRAQPLAIGVLSSKRLQFRDKLSSLAEREVGVDAPLNGDQAKLLEAADLCFRKLLAPQVGESGSAPEAKSLLEDPRCVLRRRGLRIGEELLEAEEVEPVRLDPDQVAALSRLDRVCRR